ncbi:hypothetical protein SCOCK_270086 [Actinacidiphila cocklensis]|uniref:Uncharacterized protein n=1 Tax=Actinacidiphila cocklensis TaxID=887465 RepID=A0A9W4DN62_9ACTN|nr:hypothetical protein SCOCK_270086 [Actinacidiphila cocklensis]
MLDGGSGAAPCGGRSAFRRWPVARAVPPPELRPGVPPAPLLACALPRTALAPGRGSPSAERVSVFRGRRLLSRWLGEVGGEPDAVAQVQGDRRDEHRPYDERVEQHAESHGEADLREGDDRQRAEDGERAGQHQAGRGDDAARGGKPGAHPLPRAQSGALLPDAGHQEDVVVDAKRDQEDEDEQRERGVLAGVAEDVAEDDRADAQRRREGQHHRRDEHQRCDQGAQQHRQDEHHDQQDHRDEQLVVPRGRLRGVLEDRGPAADLRVGARQLVQGGPRPVDRGACGAAVGAVGEGRLQVDAAVLLRGDARRGADGAGDDAGDRPERRGDLRRGARVGDDDHRLAAAGREVAVLEALADDRVGGVGEGVGTGEADRVEGEQAEAERAEHDHRGHPHGARAAADPLPDPRPHPGPGRLGGADVRDDRPEDPASDDHQERGEERDHRDQGDRDADRGDRAEARGGVHVGGQQAQHAQGDGRGAGDDRGAGPVQGHRHRLVPVLVAAELLPVAGHEQQRVVRTGAEDQHGEDAGALRVDHQSRVPGQQVDQRLRGEEGGDHREHRQHEQAEAAVGDQQDHDDDGECRVEEGAVDAGEGLAGVGRVAAGSRDVDLEPVAALFRGGPQVVDRVLDRGPAALLDRDRHDHLGGPRRLLAVQPGAGGAGADDAVGGHRAHGRGVAADRGDVGRGEPAGPGVDDHRGCGLGDELLLDLQDFRRLRLSGQPARRVVLLRVHQLLRQRRERHQHDHPQHQHDPFAAPPAHQVRQPSRFARHLRDPPIRSVVAPVLSHGRAESGQATASHRCSVPARWFRGARVVGHAARSAPWTRFSPPVGDLVCWAHERADQPQHPFRGLRPARRGGEGRRGRRLAPCRRDGQPLRAQPDAGSAGGGVAAQGDRHAAGLPPDDREPGPLGAGLRRGGRVLGDLPRRGGHRPGPYRPGDPCQGRPRLDGAAARDADRAVRGPAARAGHAADHDDRTGLRRAAVPGHHAAQDPPHPGADRQARPRPVAAGGRRGVGRDHRALRGGRRRQLRRGHRGLRRRRPRGGGTGAARAGRRGPPALTAAPGYAPVTPGVCEDERGADQLGNWGEPT